MHKSDAGKLAVVAVLFKQGQKNAALEKVFAAMPAKEDGKADLAGGMNVTKLLPTKRSYWAFEGSLTTPPCSEATFCCAAQPDLQKFKLTAR